MNRRDFVYGVIRLVGLIIAFGYGTIISVGDSLVFLMFLSLTLIFIGLLIFSLIKRHNIKILSETAPVFSLSAKVVSKNGNIFRNRYKIPLHAIYRVTFEIPDGHSKTFTVGADVFSRLSENDGGTLTFREKGKFLMFVGFEHT